MGVSEVREKYLRFFKTSPRNHKEISPTPLVLKNDPTTLFTSSGMQPLVPYLLGEPHPSGSKRLANSQPSIRLQDIEEVGDNRHTTFFEMLGNWSLGDYFKKEQLSWFYEFLTKELGLARDKLWVSVFEGNNQVPKDEESFKIWKKLGIPDKRIFFYDAKKNWWSMTGTPEEMQVGHIGGPDSEVFYDFGEWRKIHENSPFKDRGCHPNCDCGRFLEIGNSVFIQYKKVAENKLEELPQKNVDFGGGLERFVAATKDDPDIFFGDSFWPIIEVVQDISAVKFIEAQQSYRIVADHIKAATFLIVNGVLPSNKQQGYVLRRLIRRAVVKMKNIRVPEAYMISTDSDYEGSIYGDIVDAVFTIYCDLYFQNSNINDVIKIIEEEAIRFYSTLERGGKELGKVAPFDLYQTYGLPLETIEELYKERGLKFARKEIEKEIERHKELSRSTSKGMFKGGLADHSPEVVRLHTATHLLLASLRKVLGDHVVQKGQNVTKDRARFDFPNPEKLTEEQLKKVEDMINDVVKKDLPVSFSIMSKDEAEKTGAIHAFNEKYSDTVKVYTIGPTSPKLRGALPFSNEFCGGPHVSHTGQIGHVRIKKQEKIGTGLIRIYAALEI